MWEILREFVHYLRTWLFTFSSGDYAKVSWCFQCASFWKFISNSGQCFMMYDSDKRDIYVFHFLLGVNEL